MLKLGAQASSISDKLRNSAADCADSDVSKHLEAAMRAAKTAKDTAAFNAAAA